MKKETKAKPGAASKLALDPKRRKRNMELARESRKRKKEYIKSLEARVEELEAQNRKLEKKMQEMKHCEKIRGLKSSKWL